jgi:hypothetical protein
MRFVRCYRHHAYVHPGDLIEVIDPGSIVLMRDEDAKLFVERGHGEYDPGPERLARGLPVDRIEKLGLDPRPPRAERMTAGPQKG